MLDRFKRTSVYFFGFITLVFLFHLFFLQADPNVRVAFNSVDAYTDEGLYTGQLRNFIHHGNLDLTEGDALLKAPLFNILLAPAFLIFGTHLAVARITVLLACIFIICISFLKCRTLRPTIFIFCGIALLQFHLFTYMHLSMAESIGTLCLVAGILFSARAFFSYRKEPEEFNLIKMLLPSFLFFTTAIYLKSSFVSSVILFNIAIPFAVYFRKHPALHYKDSVRAAIWLAAASLFLYWVAWYLPLYRFFNYIMHKETSERFAHYGDIYDTVKKNYLAFFHAPEMKYIMNVFYVCLVLTPFIWIRSRSPQFRYLVFCIVAWMLLEVPKLATFWVPARYLLPAICAVLLYIAVVIAELIAMSVSLFYFRWSRLWKALAITGLSFLFIMNVYEQVNNFNERKYLIQDMNRRVAATLKPDETIVGAWAPTFAWETKARAIPVWDGYMNDSATLQRFRPHIVASDQFLDSMFVHQQTPLPSISDSSVVVNFHIRDHQPVTVYWLKKEYWEK